MGSSSEMYIDPFILRPKESFLGLAHLDRSERRGLPYLAYSQNQLYDNKFIITGWVSDLE